MATHNLTQPVGLVGASEPALVVPILPPSLSPTVFHEPWWLEAVTAGRYREASVRSGGREVGRLPYLMDSILGLEQCILPELTHVLGPAIDDGGGRPLRRRQVQRTITLELLDQLPPFSRFRQRLHRDWDDTLPFLERGFVTEAEFTHEIEPASTEQIWANIRDTTRRVIRRARERSQVVEVEPEALVRFYESNLIRRGSAFNYMWKSTIVPVLRAALDRGRGRLLGIQDRQGVLEAALFFIWDDRATHLVLTTRSPNCHSGLIGELIWTAMKESAEHHRIFDFGGVNAGSVPFYASLGGCPKPRYLVQRATPLFHMVDFSQRKARGLHGRLRAGIARAWAP